MPADWSLRELNADLYKVNPVRHRRDELRDLPKSFPLTSYPLFSNLDLTCFSHPEMALSECGQEE
ncbi:unannotated protein [freshwater metagenome]|uniref:Unannotated protein n=1 Tax=freshwater metagenome TaxID=449393 RepID=A0A6J6MJZ0_9ZZZZ